MFNVRLLLIVAECFVTYSFVIGEDGVASCLIPESLGEVEFGEPVFLPVTFVNGTKNAIIVPDLSKLSSEVELHIGCGKHQRILSLNTGMGFAGSTKLKPFHTMTTTLMINVWTPDFASEFLRTQQARIEVRTASTSEAIERLNAMPSLRETTITLRGSSFINKPSAMLAKLDVPKLNADWGFHNETSVEHGITTMTSYSPLNRGLTPLCWITTPTTESEWVSPNSKLVQQARASVRRGSQAELLLDFSIALDDLVKSISRQDEAQKIRQVIDIIRRSQHPERQWFIGATAEKLFGSPINQQDFKAQMLRAFPASAPQFLGSPSFSKIVAISTKE